MLGRTRHAVLEYIVAGNFLYVTLYDADNKNEHTHLEYEYTKYPDVRRILADVVKIIRKMHCLFSLRIIPNKQAEYLRDATEELCLWLKLHRINFEVEI